MANGFIHHYYLVGRSRFGPFVILISTQISIIFFRVPFTLSVFDFLDETSSKVLVFLRQINILL
jgi:hypothetical protein